jgi:hypothetical protein
MSNLINDLAAIDIELADWRQPNAPGQTPEYWTAAAARTRLLKLISKDERIDLPAK